METITLEVETVALKELLHKVDHSAPCVDHLYPVERADHSSDLDLEITVLSRQVRENEPTNSILLTKLEH